LARRLIIEHVTADHRIAGELVALFEAPKQRTLLIVADARGGDPGVEIFSSPTPKLAARRKLGANSGRPSLMRT
jgi:hypothetical protein